MAIETSYPLQNEIGNFFLLINNSVSRFLSLSYPLSTMVYALLNELDNIV